MSNSSSSFLSKTPSSGEMAVVLGNSAIWVMGGKYSR